MKEIEFFLKIFTKYRKVSKLPFYECCNATCEAGMEQPKDITKEPSSTVGKGVQFRKHLDNGRIRCENQHARQISACSTSG